MINPYSPPTSNPELNQDPRDLAKSRLSRPATALIIMASIHSVFVTIVLVSNAVAFASSNFHFDNAIDTALASIQLISLILIAIGGAKMAFLESLPLARLGAVLACIPFLSPFIVLGIPFGIWALLLLNNPDNQAFFPSGKKPTPLGNPSG